jgi:DNA-binding transcriptional ArsR family regulator
MKKTLAREKVTRFFSSLADKTRLEIILSVAENPKTVNQIYEKVGKGKMTLSAISHQLRTLSDLGIVTSEKNGKEKKFELSDKYCWCILKDTFSQFGNKIRIRCKKCGHN